MDSRAEYEPAAIRRAEAVLGRRSFGTDRRRLNAEDLLREVNPAEREILQTLSPDRRERLRAAAFLLRGTAISLDLGSAPRQRYLRAAAELFENLAGEAEETGDRRTTFQVLSQAAACWSLAGFQANAVVMGSKIRKRFPELDPGEDLSPAPESLDFYTAMASVLQRDLQGLGRLLDARTDFLDDLEEYVVGTVNGDSGAADLVEFVVLGRLLDGLAEALAFWQAGRERGAARAEAMFEEAERLALHAELPDVWLVVNSIREIFAQSVRSSTWHTFRKYVSAWGPLWHRYVRSLAVQKQPVVELWPSQVLALEAGLLDPERSAMVIRTPTSSGKTRMAEAAILDTVARDPLDACCVYVVPFRALATEVEAGLGATLGDLGIRVSSLFGGYESSDLEDFLLSSSDVLIVTPEKLDLALRAEPGFKDRVKLFVVDEGQLLGDENARAIRLEILLSRLRRAAPTARVLFMSAVVPNVEQVARWLDPDGQPPVDQDWRPTRLLTGVFRWAGDRGRIDYQGQEEFFVPYVLTRQKRSLGLTPVRRQPTKPRPWPESTAETAAELALHFQQIGPVVVFAAQPRNCRAVCSALETGLRQRGPEGDPPTLVPSWFVAEIDELVSLAARQLGADHELIPWLRLGIAYHHARVPEPLRVRIEDAFRSGALQIIVCTTTLSQGVNLPVKTLIVSHTLRGKDDPVSVRDFWNIAGRAGRANRETRGQVILIESSTSREAQRQRSYLDPANIEPLQSRLLELFAWLVRERCPSIEIRNVEDVTAMTVENEIDPDIEELLDQEELVELEAQILALCEEIVDGENLDKAEQILGASLAGVQLSDLGAPIRPFARFVVARARRAEDQVPDLERRLLYYRTGLSAASCIALDEAVGAIVNRYGDGLWNDDNQRGLRADLLTAAFSIVETAPSEGVSVDLAVEISQDWMGYASMEELRARYGARHEDLADPTILNLFVQETLVRSAPWSLSAALSILETHLSDELAPPDFFRALPSLMKFGVDSPQAAYASTLAAEDRDTARKLADLAIGDEVEAGFAAFMKWLSELLVEDLRLALGDEPDTDRLARRIARLSTSDLALQLLLGKADVVAAVRGLEYGDRRVVLSDLEPEQAVRLVREPDNPYDTNAILVLNADDADLGYLAREVARGIAGRLDEDPQSVDAKVLEADTNIPLLRLKLTLT
jgi:superfamily II DNA/RNA helicase